MVQVMMLDSGCTQSLMPMGVYQNIHSAFRSQIRPIQGHGILADGSKIAFKGVADVTFKIGDHEYRQEFVLADISHHVLLGLDFFERTACSIDFRTAQLIHSGITTDCCNEAGDSLKVNVQVCRQQEVPANSEQLIRAKFTRPWQNRGTCVESLGRVPGLLVATTLVRDQTTHLELRVCNITDHAIHLPAGKVIASGSEAIQIETDHHDDSSSEGPTQALPEALDKLITAADLSRPDRARAREVLARNADIFSLSKYDLGRTNMTQHDIPLVAGAHPIKQRPYRHGPVQEAEIERQVRELKDQGLISEGKGAWSSPVVLVKKKDGSWRFCVDYRRLNEVTAKDAYPLPRIDESLDSLGHSKYFSTLDLTSGYWQVELKEDAKEKTAFTTRNGLYQWEVLPFGLTSAPSTFERLMETALRGLHWKTALIYLDDIIVFAPDMSTHLTRLEEVFERLRAANLKLKPEKCKLFARRVKYLGHVVSDEGVEVDEDKIVAIRDWPTPRCKRDVQAFLGTCGYYRRFISKYSEISRPLSQAAARDHTFVWDDECQEAFEVLKDRLTSTPVLSYPDYELPFVLDTDASKVGTGAVLSQVQGGQEKVIAYYSKMMTPEERNYCVTRQEMVAIIKAIKHFRPHLYGKKFLVRTDHASLSWLMRVKQPTGQLARWLETLSEYDFTLQHRRGLRHNNADGLSRQSCGDCRQCAKMRGPEEVDGTERLGLGSSARLTQVVGRPVPLPRRSLGCDPGTPWSVRRSDPWETPRLVSNDENQRVKVIGPQEMPGTREVSQTSGAPREVVVEGLTREVAEEGAPPPLSWAQVAELMRWTSGASRDVEVEGLTAQGRTCPSSRQRIGAARHTSGAPRQTGVEDSAKGTIREGVPPPLSWAQVAGAAGQDSGALQKAGVEGPARKMADEGGHPLADKTRGSKRAMAKPQGDNARVGQVERSTRHAAESPLRAEQLEDEGIAVVMRALERGVEPDERVMGEEAHALWRLKEHLWLDTRGVLRTTGSTEAGRVVCPRGKRKHLVLATHQEAHLGATKTLAAIKLSWYWPGMTGLVRRLVRECTACQGAKAPPERVRARNHLYAGRPWQVLAIDLFGPLPQTQSGNNVVLVMTDHFTRWCDAIPLPDGKAATVARALDERVFAYFGVPERIHSDQGRQFQSELFQACCELWGCEKTETTPYRPQGNSVVERLNRTLGNSLRALLIDHEGEEWDRLLPQIVRTLRATPHRVTGETANMLLMGREARLPPNIHHPVELPEYTTDEYIAQLKERLDTVRERLRRTQGPREMADIEPIYRPGDQVWLKSYFKGKGKGAKLQPKFIGPYRVLRALPYQVYEVERGGRKTLQHEGRIKMYYAGEDTERVRDVNPRRDTPTREEVPREEETVPATEENMDIGYLENPEPLLPGGLQHLELPAVPQSEEGSEGSEEEAEAPIEASADESDPEEPHELAEEPAAEEEAAGVVDVPRREMPARERRPPAWLREYVSRLYRMYCYVTQRTEPVLEGGDVVKLYEHTLKESGGGPEKGRWGC